MPRRVTESSFQAFSLDPTHSEPLHRQLYDELRRSILDGRIAPGSRLPASRELAHASRVSRNTVLSAYDQLLAEGYILSRPGSGTYVADMPPEAMVPEPLARPEGGPGPPAQRRLSQRGALVDATELVRFRRTVQGVAFRPGLPALEHFPLDQFRRIIDRCFRRAAPSVFAYGDPQGYLPLREAIATHLAAARGARCDAGNIVVVNGAQQGITLCARLLTDVGDAVWLEEPGYFGARAAFESVGARVVPVAVDRDGIDVAAGLARAPQARLAYVTPSHQNPLGVTMSLARRKALLQWAESADSWVVEDDNACEYRLSGRPLAALQGIDAQSRVVYIGSFSKVMFSSMRLGYVVLPRDLVQAFVHAHEIHERGSGNIQQIAMAEFMHEGHFARHLRRMRTLYSARLQALQRAVARRAPDVLELQPVEGGLNQLAWLPRGLDDVQVSSELARAGVLAAPLSQYSITPQPRGALVLGFASVDEEAMDAAVEKLALVVRGMLRAAPTRA